jgi:hypothetical protein
MIHDSKLQPCDERITLGNVMDNPRLAPILSPSKFSLLAPLEQFREHLRRESG